MKSLIRHFERASKYTQEEVLNSKEKEPVDTPVMVAQFNPHNPPIKEFIRNNWNIITSSEECSEVFTKPPLIGYRKLPNLKDILTRAKIEYPPRPISQQVPAGLEICKKFPRCTYCPLLTKLDEVKSNHFGTTFALNLPKKSRLTCNISNVVYLIWCTKCNKQYVGETGRMIWKTV